MQATYFLVTRNVFYNLASEEGEHALARLRELGHRVGHHAVNPNIGLDGRFDPVVAWHNPNPGFMAGLVEGAVNVMSEPWFSRDHYRSDSNQHWRAGCPHAELAAPTSSGCSSYHLEIWVYPGETMRETMHSMLDASASTTSNGSLRTDRPVVKDLTVLLGVWVAWHRGARGAARERRAARSRRGDGHG